MGNICSQNKWRNLLKDVGKTGAKLLENLGENSTQTLKFIGLEKLAVGVQVACRSTVARI